MWLSRSFVCFAVVACSSTVALAQTAGSGPFTEYVRDKMEKFPSDGTKSFMSLPDAINDFSSATTFLKVTEGMTPGVAYPIKLSTWTIPFTFGRLDKDKAGDWRIGANLAIGAGYIWVHGRGVLNEANESIDVEPHFIYGFAGNFGATNSVDGTSGVTTSLSLGGIVGFRSFAAMVGYDILTESVVLGISQHVDVFSLAKDSYRLIRFGP